MRSSVFACVVLTKTNRQDTYEIIGGRRKVEIIVWRVLIGASRHVLGDDEMHEVKFALS